MSRAFARIAFTPAVQAIQSRFGSRDAYLAGDVGVSESDRLGSHEIAFIEARDGFYQATVGETGWPYVQHRGGPAGFLKVLDPRTIGYADFSGNAQYLSVGNLSADDRVSLILMDYPAQRRLKIWGRARIVEEDADPSLIARLETPTFRAPVERGVVIAVEAFDWNCPKYITPRYTEAEAIRLFSAPSGISAAEPAVPARAGTIGSGSLALVVSGIRQLTPRVRAYELRAPDGSDLPAVEPGAHVVVPVRLANGAVTARQYSLVADPGRRDRVEIAVLREDEGRGASRAIHDTWTIGTRLALESPVNQFHLQEDSRHSVLIAGGIGITPILSMARALKARGRSFELHASAHTPADLPYRHELESEFWGPLRQYFTRADGGTRLDLGSVLRNAPFESPIYVCGPARLVDAARAAARGLGIADGRLRVESFA